MELVFEEIHSNLTWNHIFLFAIFREESSYLDPKVSRYGLNEILIAAVTGSDTLRCRHRWGERSDRELRQTHRYILDRRWCTTEIILGNDLIEYSFDLSDIGRDVLSDELCDILWEEELSGSRLLTDDSETSLIVRFTDIDRDTPLESAL